MLKRLELFVHPSAVSKVTREGEGVAQQNTHTHSRLTYLDVVAFSPTHPTIGTYGTYYIVYMYL